MINQLEKLSKFLEKNNLNKEANLLRKIAQEDEELIDIISPEEGFGGSSFKRDRVLPDQRSREGYYIKNEINSGNYHEKWYGAISELGDKVILIPFDSSSLDDDDIWNISSIFGQHHDNYNDLKKSVSLFHVGYSDMDKGDLETLKENFPSLWSEILATLNRDGLEEDEVVYVLYNQENVNKDRLQFFTKDEFYFAHDMGHAVFDSKEDYEFKALLHTFIKDMITLYEYRNEDDESIVSSLYDDFSEKKEIDDENEVVEKFIMDFFTNLRSEPSDAMADVFASFASGNIAIRPAEYIYYEGNEYTLTDNLKANNIIQEYIKDMKNYMKNEKTGEGPLSFYKGYVVLFDL